MIDPRTWNFRVFALGGSQAHELSAELRFRARKLAETTSERPS